MKSRSGIQFLLLPTEKCCLVLLLLTPSPPVFQVVWTGYLSVLPGLEKAIATASASWCKSTAPPAVISVTVRQQKAAAVQRKRKKRRFSLNRAAQGAAVNRLPMEQREPTGPATQSCDGVFQESDFRGRLHCPLEEFYIVFLENSSIFREAQ